MEENNSPPKNRTIKTITNGTRVIRTHHDNTTKRFYKQIYRKIWESSPIFQGWLSPVPCDKYKAVCTVCKKELLAHRLSLLKHASSAKHLKEVASVANRSQSTNATTKNSNLSERNKTKEHQINHTNKVDSSPQLLIINNSKSQFTDTKTKNRSGILIQFKKNLSEHQPQISQLTVSNNETNASGTVSVARNLPNLDPLVGITDTSGAINIKDGYVAKNKTPRTVLCAATYIDPKINQTTTHPLQISTRVTDYSRGISAVNLAITLYMLTGGKWLSVGQNVTDNTGRCNLFHKNHTLFGVGLYKLHYDVATYYNQENLKSYFPFIEIVFKIKSLQETHHIPLMISPNSYSAYKSADC